MRKSFATRWRGRRNVPRSLTLLRRVAFALCAASASAFVLTGAAASVQETGARRIVVIGDLHLGVGRDPSGAWHATEDFRWAEEFQPFLTTLAA